QPVRERWSCHDTNAPPAPSEAIDGAIWIPPAMHRGSPFTGHPLAGVPEGVRRCTYTSPLSARMSRHAMSAPPAPSDVTELYCCVREYRVSPASVGYAHTTIPLSGHPGATPPVAVRCCAYVCS